MNITLKQARALRDALKEASPEFIENWRAILNKDSEKAQETNEESVENNEA